MRGALPITDGREGGPIAIRADGPPNYDGPRVIIAGDAAAFRMLAGTLLAMADVVESDPEIRGAGWSVVIDPGDVPNLKMDDGVRLVLDCDAYR